MLYKFISKSILSKIVNIKNYHFEYKDYKINVVKNKKKNSLYYTIEFAKLDKWEILSCYIYINVSKFKQNFYLKFNFATYNFFDNNAEKNNNNNLSLIIN